MNLSFFKNTIKSEPLGVRGKYFQNFHISMVPSTGKSDMDDLTWNYPMKNFFLLATIAMIVVNMVFTHFHSSSYQGNIFLHQNQATYQTIIEKMEM